MGNVLQNHCGTVYHNISVARLVELALIRGEGVLTSSGALRVLTGKYTGRSPDDKFVVESHSVVDEIWWQNNQKMSQTVFDSLYSKVLAYLKGKDLFVFEGYAGGDAEYSVPVQVVNEFAWQNLFARQLFVRDGQKNNTDDSSVFTVIAAPGFRADKSVDGTNSEAFVILNLTQRIILIGGTHYAGEIKKAVFSVMNYFLPKQNILSMHCAANKGKDDKVALFFGLSGTGKTSLSADTERLLIGDDEHGWSEKGIFNIEGGCYAKCINLSYDNEPQIWEAIRFGSVLENVAMDEDDRTVDFVKADITENTRAAYPINYIPNSVYPGIGNHPQTIVFLTADAFGVLPPIAKLTPEQAMYYFLSGYTSKLAGTERGVAEPQATFSACFGSPFLPLAPQIYANLLKDKIAKHNTRVFLINTGWQGGPYGVGERISIKHTRRMVTAALSGQLDNVAYTTDDVFNLAIPNECPGVPQEFLMPNVTWQDQEAYQRSAERLAAMFHTNFANLSGLSPEVVAAGPVWKQGDGFAAT